MNDDFGFTLHSEDELVNEAKLQVASGEQDKVKKILAIIQPLLTQLAKDPEKTVINWRDRVKVIEGIQAKIAQVVKG